MIPTADSEPLSACSYDLYFGVYWRLMQWKQRRKVACGLVSRASVGKNPVGGQHSGNDVTNARGSGEISQKCRRTSQTAPTTYSSWVRRVSRTQMKPSQALPLLTDGMASRLREKRELYAKNMSQSPKVVVCGSEALEQSDLIHCPAWPSAITMSHKSYFISNPADYSAATEMWSSVVLNNSAGEMKRLVEAARISTDVSEELNASIRVTRIGELGTTLAVTSNRCTLRRNTLVLTLIFSAHHDHKLVNKYTRYATLQIKLV
jgi:hypothetical protein